MKRTIALSVDVQSELELNAVFHALVTMIEDQAQFDHRLGKRMTRVVNATFTQGGEKHTFQLDTYAPRTYP